MQYIYHIISYIYNHIILYYIILYYIYNNNMQYIYHIISYIYIIYLCLHNTFLVHCFGVAFAELLATRHQRIVGRHIGLVSLNFGARNWSKLLRKWMVI